MEDRKKSLERFDRKVAHLIAMEAKEALSDLAAKYGMVIEYRGGSYEDAIFKPRFEFCIPAAADEKHRKDFEMFAHFINAKPEWYGREFTANNGVTYKIVGLKTNRPKSPIELVDVKTGKAYKCAPEMISRYIKPEVK